VEFDRKEILKSSAAKLKKLREQLGYSPKEMAEYFGIEVSSYYKNENGQYLPGLESLHLLSKDHDISLDWYLFDKGPVVYAEKGQAGELRNELEAARQKIAALEQKTGELEKHNETLTKECSEYREKASVSEKAAAVKPEVEELLDHMARVPLLYFEVMTHFQRFKIENRELIETTME
jgi:transcriptional regulator with XRE-family HTH domain